MRLLLDTHAFLWFVLDEPQLSSVARELIVEPTNDVLVSLASYWEIAIKVSPNKISLQAPYAEFMKRGIEGNQLEVLPIETQHAGAVISLPYHHRDPFNRLLVAQALVEQIPLASNDHALDAYGVTRLW